METDKAHVFADVNEALVGLSNLLLQQGEEVRSRAGNTLEVTNLQITLADPLRREILLRSRKASVVAQVAETMWVLSGRNDVDWLARYLPRAPQFSDDGEIWRAGYGQRLRHYGLNGHKFRVPVRPGSRAGTDQLHDVHRLLAQEPETRRAVMTIWDPTVDITQSEDIPCNNWLHWTIRDGRLNLHVATRSNDLVWGWSGINQFEWSVLLEVMAQLLEVEVGGITYSISSLHAYEQHWDRLRSIAEDKPVARYSDRVRFAPPAGMALDRLIEEWFAIESRIRAGEHCLEDIRDYPEPLFRQFLGVIYWYWRRDPLFVTDDSLREALTLTRPYQSNHFVDYVANLHAEKAAVYGDSWCRRGEMMGILGNIARKVDRLGAAGAGDTNADTAIDLLVYLLLYQLWLVEHVDTGIGEKVALQESEDGRLTASSGPYNVAQLLVHYSRDKATTFASVSDMEEQLVSDFDTLEENLQDPQRWKFVDGMIRTAYALASNLFWKESNERRSWNPEA